ncbi:hypothetical protein SJ05684_c21450 [Sinorhizobium sojae CCBAU 05684]|uniref:Uncharacterized protein n=1 Tax=Sinorhizobium sojae CCBAU 05684 TaxID=716928 RepID=A0A249PCN1_9HYPH|nr:hypothetical protein SJ05684_c21450 [Sinorhizobium sojae CCBAU 05684]
MIVPAQGGLQDSTTAIAEEDGPRTAAHEADRLPLAAEYSV